jgi:hypothetical protein
MLPAAAASIRQARCSRPPLRVPHHHSSSSHPAMVAVVLLRIPCSTRSWGRGGGLRALVKAQFDRDVDQCVAVVVSQGHLPTPQPVSLAAEGDAQRCHQLGRSCIPHTVRAAARQLPTALQVVINAGPSGCHAAAGQHLQPSRMLPRVVICLVGAQCGGAAATSMCGALGKQRAAAPRGQAESTVAHLQLRAGRHHDGSQV